MPDMTPAQANEILRDAAKFRDLTAWEINFVRDLSRPGATEWLTEAQIGVLRKIEHKIYRT